MEPKPAPLPDLASIGTSGFSYAEWKGAFYPEWMPSRDWFHYYATRFNAIEINLTFYRRPTQTMLERWKLSAPSGFTFVLKASKVITHQARLARCADEVAQMIDDDSALGASLGCILFQLPPSLRRNTGLLSRFLQEMTDCLESAETKTRLAFEFRHESWNSPETLEILTRRGCAMVIHDMVRSGGWRWQEGKLTGGGFSMSAEELLSKPVPLLYLRFHGTTGKYAGRYGEKGLAPWSELARAALARAIPVHAYFNNTSAGEAVADAMELGNQLSGRRGSPTEYGSQK
jgi:uncharacterized protein YecE (DUF72 family)